MQSNNEGLKVENTVSLSPNSTEQNADQHFSARAFRQQFIKDIYQVLNANSDRQLPMGMKTVLSNLLTACDKFLDQDEEMIFLLCFQDTLTLLAKGWNSYSQWVAAEQITCYSIYWGLKTALEKHQKRQGLLVEEAPVEESLSIWQKMSRAFRKVSHFFHNYDFEYHQWGSSFDGLKNHSKQDK